MAEFELKSANKRDILGFGAAGLAFSAAVSASGILLAPSGAMAQASSAGAGLGPLIAPNSRHVKIEGRYGPYQNGLMRIGFPGVTFHMRANASKMILRSKAINPTLNLEIYVDDEPMRMVRLSETLNDLVIFEGEKRLRHVKVVKRNEAWMGQWDVAGFALSTDGSFYTPDALPRRKFMFIGDSITAGDGAEADREDHREHCDLSGSSATYGKLLAGRFNGQGHIVAYGGRGLIRDWRGDMTAMSAQQFFERAVPDDEASVWDHRQYVPDIVTICLGTNDFASGIPDENLMKAAATSLINRINVACKRPHIFLLQSPMLDDNPNAPKRTLQAQWMMWAAEHANSRKVHYVPLPHTQGRVGDAHPRKEEQRQIADVIAPHIRAVL